MPSDIHEILALILCSLIVTGLINAFFYIQALTRFFKELRTQEPDVWTKIGSPTLPNMLFLPLVNFHKFYTFYPVLKERRQSPYRYAKRAWIFLWMGLALFAMMCFPVIWLIIITLSG